VTIAKRPFEWGGMAEDTGVIWYSEKQNIFIGEGWTFKNPARN
jgi:hypothetical protein